MWRFCLRRTSQFIVSVNKYLEAINQKCNIGMRLKMRLEGDDSTETDKRYQNLLLQLVSLW